jgi:hypothetical protein
MRKRGARIVILLGVAMSPFIAASCLDFSSLGGGADASDAPFQSDSLGLEQDAIGSDAGSTFDAGPDAGFCASHPGHTLCDDFDDPGYLALWNQPRDLNNDGAIDQDPVVFLSPPYSLEAQMGQADGPSYAYLVTKFAQVPNALRIEFDFFLASGGNSTISLANILLPGSVSFTLKLTEPSPPLFQMVEVTRDDAGVVYSNLANVSYIVEIGQWYHVIVNFDLLGADAGEVDVTFNHGTQVTDQAAVPLSLDASSAYQIQAGAGSFSSTPYLSSSVRLDNFLVDSN